MSEKRFRKMETFQGFCDIFDNEKTICSVRIEYADTLLNLLNSLSEENEQLKSLVNACEYGQKNLMEEMKNNDEALDKIWEIMKELYGVIEDE